jgi:hypothetical protein
MFTIVAFAQSVDSAGVADPILAVLDQHIRVNGDDIFIPDLNQIVAAMAGVETTTESFARLVSPSLRGLGRLQIEPYNTAGAAAVEPASPPLVYDIAENPLALTPQEALNFEINSNPAAAQIQWCVVWLADGPIVPVTGKIFSVIATGATALVAVAATATGWTNVPLTFDEDLPRGRYAVVGMRARSAGMIAARLVTVGGRWRPGVPGCDAQSDQDHWRFRAGQFGVFAEFEDVDTPSVDCIAISADAAQDFVFDLIQLRAGPA